jgi:hypothetical protein
VCLILLYNFFSECFSSRYIFGKLLSKWYRSRYNDWLRAGRPMGWVQVPVEASFFASPRRQTGSGPHTASYPMVTGGVKLTTHLQLVRKQQYVDLYLRSSHISSSRTAYSYLSTGTTLPLLLPQKYPQPSKQSSCKVPAGSFNDFNKNWNVSINLSKTPQYKISCTRSPVLESIHANKRQIWELRRTQSIHLQSTKKGSPLEQNYAVTSH